MREALIDPSCVLLATVDYAPDEWHLQSSTESTTFRPTGPHFGVNDMEPIDVALRAGAGIGLLAGFSAIEELRAGPLVRVLPEFTPTREMCTRCTYRDNSWTRRSSTSSRH